MRAEQALQAAAAERIHDKHVSGGRARVQWNALRSRLKLSECVGKPDRISADFSSRRIGLILARTGDRHLNEQSGDRREDDHQNAAEQTTLAITVIAASATENH